MGAVLDLDHAAVAGKRGQPAGVEDGAAAEDAQVVAVLQHDPLPCVGTGQQAHRASGSTEPVDGRPGESSTGADACHSRRRGRAARRTRPLCAFGPAPRPPAAVAVHENASIVTSTRAVRPNVFIAVPPGSVAPTRRSRHGQERDSGDRAWRRCGPPGSGSSAGSRPAACARSRRGCRRSGRRAARAPRGRALWSWSAVVGEPPRDGHRSAAGHRRQQADFVGRRDRRIEPREVADVLAVDVDVDEPVEVAVVGQQLAAERRVALDERVDDARIESPSSSSDFAPPTFGRRTDGMKTVLMRARRARPCRPGRSWSSGTARPRRRSASPAGGRPCAPRPPRRSRPGRPGRGAA